MLTQQEKIKVIEKVIRTINRLNKSTTNGWGIKDIKVFDHSIQKKVVLTHGTGLCNWIRVLCDIWVYSDFENIMPELFHSCESVILEPYGSYFWPTNEKGWEKRLQALKMTLKQLKHDNRG